MHASKHSSHRHGPSRLDRPLKRLATLAASGLLAAPAALAQSDIVPAKPQSRPIAIVNAVVHTATAAQPVIERGHVVFDGGRIVSVGAGNPTLPEGCEIVDAQGMHVSPGFCSMPTSLGLVETLQVEATDDRSEYGDYRPEAVPAVAVNPIAIFSRLPARPAFFSRSSCQTAAPCPEPLRRFGSTVGHPRTSRSIAPSAW